MPTTSIRRFYSRIHIRPNRDLRAPGPLVTFTRFICRRKLLLIPLPKAYHPTHCVRRGVFYYTIIETRESAHPQVVDYTLTCERRGSLRPIHRYSRIERFESILYQLIGARGKVPKRIINYIKLVGYDKQPELLWESIRAILKEKGWRLYYNRIPTILQMLGESKTINFQDQALLISEIVIDFRKLSAAFDRRPGGRKYFPNLRFIALKLLEAHGAVFEYMIPFIRTPRKIASMDRVWQQLVQALSK